MKYGWEVERRVKSVLSCNIGHNTKIFIQNLIFTISTEKGLVHRLLKSAIIFI